MLLLAIVPSRPSEPAPATPDRRVLVFSATAGFRHASIPDAVAALRRLGAENGFAVDATEDATVFADAQLSAYDAIVFALTTGDVLDAAQQEALQRYVRRGGGFVGIHSASDTEHGWSWYGELVGAFFVRHPAVASATVDVADGVHPSTRGLPARWTRVDEWYEFDRNPRDRVHVLATVDEATYAGGTMGADHPIAWCRFFDGGRTWYTAMGHTSESYADPLFLEHLLGGIRFAAGYPDCDDGALRPRSVPPR